MKCKSCGAPIPYGSFGNVKCEYCNSVTYVPVPGEGEKKESGDKIVVIERGGPSGSMLFVLLLVLGIVAIGGYYVYSSKMTGDTAVGIDRYVAPATTTAPATKLEPATSRVRGAKKAIFYDDDLIIQIWVSDTNGFLSWSENEKPKIFETFNIDKSGNIYKFRWIFGYGYTTLQLFESGMAIWSDIWSGLSEEVSASGTWNSVTLKEMEDEKQYLMRSGIPNYQQYSEETLSAATTLNESTGEKIAEMEKALADEGYKALEDEGS